MCSSFKRELMNGEHQFGAPTLVSRTSLTSPTPDSFMAALYLVAATLGAATTAYSATNEVSGTGYSPGGVNLTGAQDWISPALDGTTAHSTPTNDIVYTSVTLASAFDAVLIYNSTQSNKAVSVHTFGSTTVDGTLTLQMPTNDGTTGLIRLT